MATTEPSSSPQVEQGEEFIEINPILPPQQPQDEEQRDLELLQVQMRMFEPSTEEIINLRMEVEHQKDLFIKQQQQLPVHKVVKSLARVIRSRNKPSFIQSYSK